MGLDHIKELLSGRRSLRLVLVVSDLVSDLEVLVVSAVGLIGPNLRLGWMVFLKGVSPKRSCTSGPLLPVGRHGWDRSQTCF